MTKGVRASLRILLLMMMGVTELLELFAHFFCSFDNRPTDFVQMPRMIRLKSAIKQLLFS